MTSVLLFLVSHIKGLAVLLSSETLAIFGAHFPTKRKNKVACFYGHFYIRPSSFPVMNDTRKYTTHIVDLFDDAKSMNNQGFPIQASASWSQSMTMALQNLKFLSLLFVRVV